MNVSELKKESNPFSFYKTLITLIIVLIIVQSWNDTGMNLSFLIDGGKYMHEYIIGNPDIENSGFFPPNLSANVLEVYLLAMLETIQMAVIALLLSVLIAVPLSYMSSRNILDILIPGKTPFHELIKKQCMELQL